MIGSSALDKLVEEQEQNATSLLKVQSPAPFHLDRIDDAVDDSYKYALDGTGVTVYIMDSGIRATHREFGNGRVDAACFAPPNVTCEDWNDNSHGTHCAGIIGGNTYGVAKGVRLHNVNVRNAQNELAWSQVYAGLDYILGHEPEDSHDNINSINNLNNATNNLRHVKIASLSISGQPNDQADAVVQTSLDAGIVLVVAAGNQMADACTRSPARIPEVIAVGATDYVDGMDVRRNLSNRGPCLTLWAPGSNILSASIAHDTAFEIKSGTSMAAPLVAGALALYTQAGLSVHDLLSHATRLDSLTQEDDDTTGLFLSLEKLNQLVVESWESPATEIALEEETSPPNVGTTTATPTTSATLTPSVHDTELVTIVDPVLGSVPPSHAPVFIDPPDGNETSEANRKRLKNVLSGVSIVLLSVVFLSTG